MNVCTQFLDKARQKAREKKLGQKAAEMLQKQSEEHAAKPERRRAAHPDIKRVLLGLGLGFTTLPVLLPQPQLSYYKQ